MKDNLDYIDGAKTRIVAQLDHLRNAAAEDRNPVVLGGWIDSLEKELRILRGLLKPNIKERIAQ